ncbi:hypothetical protein CYMTET_36864 [Cymbomonas tetramitiformis]|uniref:Uncharacterized protein n=1 Tax=Cymbomonas tetramitiformis TaxID=36881 RepID=A0AAE0CF46_9CHLO|nr:hypothetical protein CYMTET_36864 [Cymbomonas tetramitiformis]
MGKSIRAKFKKEVRALRGNLAKGSTQASLDARTAILALAAAAPKAPHDKVAKPASEGGMMQVEKPKKQPKVKALEMKPMEVEGASPKLKAKGGISKKKKGFKVQSAKPVSARSAYDWKTQDVKNTAGKKKAKRQRSNGLCPQRDSSSAHGNYQF